jgi:hypothetical protein
MAEEVKPGRGDIERVTTRGGKEAVFVRAEIVKDNDDRYTLFLGNVVAPIAFRRGDHRAFERLESIFDQ